MSRGDSSMPSVVMSSRRVLADKARVSPWRVAPTYAGVVALVESLRVRMSEARRQVNGLFESVLSESFGEEI
jgi:hypothetical protein